MVDICTASIMHTNHYAMSQLMSLPSNHAKHKMPQPFDKLYYLDLTLLNDNDSELVSPPTSKHIGCQLIYLLLTSGSWVTEFE